MNGALISQGPSLFLMVDSVSPTIKGWWDQHGRAQEWLTPSYRKFKVFHWLMISFLIFTLQVFNEYLLSLEGISWPCYRTTWSATSYPTKGTNLNLLQGSLPILSLPRKTTTCPSQVFIKIRKKTGCELSIGTIFFPSTGFRIKDIHWDSQVAQW